MVKHRKFDALTHLLTLLPKNRANPIAEIEAVIKVIADYFQGHEGRLKAGDHAFEVATAAVLRLMHLAYSLNRLKFWHDLQMPRKFPSDSVPEPFEDFRQKRLSELRERLKSANVTRDDLLEAMDATNDIFQSMHLQFAVGHPLGTIPADDRHWCAAILPAVATLLGETWVPIRIRLKFRAGRQ